MIRARFKVNGDDYRSVNWPVKHPYWNTGSGMDFNIVVAYADNKEEILRNWPEATEIDAKEVTDYTFNDRFPKPDWFNPEPIKRTFVEGQKILVEAEVAAVDDKNQYVLCLVEGLEDKQTLCKVPLSAIHLPTPIE